MSSRNVLGAFYRKMPMGRKDANFGKVTVVVQRQAEGVGMRAKGKPHAHGNYKAGRMRE